MDRTNQWLTLIANLGVIAGLVFLGFEMRQNTNIARASAYRDNVQDIAAWRELTITDPELSRIFGVYLDEGLHALNDEDGGRIKGLINNIMGSYENAFFARNYGIIGNDEWQRFQSGACTHFRKTQENGFDLPYTTMRFRQHLTETC